MAKRKDAPAQPPRAGADAPAVPRARLFGAHQKRKDAQASVDDYSKRNALVPKAAFEKSIRRTKGYSDALHSRHPWYKKWVQDGAKSEDLLPEQYPSGFDQKRIDGE